MESMRINSRFKMHHVADEHIVFVPGKNAGDMTHVVAFNATSQYLWNNLQGRDFTVDDVCRLLTARYTVDHKTAMADAHQWINTLQSNGVLTADTNSLEKK